METQRRQMAAGEEGLVALFAAWQNFPFIQYTASLLTGQGLYVGPTAPPGGQHKSRPITQGHLAFLQPGPTEGPITKRWCAKGPAVKQKSCSVYNSYSKEEKLIMVKKVDLGFSPA